MASTRVAQPSFVDRLPYPSCIYDPVAFCEALDIDISEVASSASALVSRKHIRIVDHQSEDLPHHILEWTKLPSGEVLICSRQGSKSVPPRERPCCEQVNDSEGSNGSKTSGRRLRFIVPTKKPLGMRKRIRDLVDDHDMRVCTAQMAMWHIAPEGASGNDTASCSSSLSSGSPTH